jgi:TolB-like protein/Tfp pilus assembly protein PilF
MKRCPTCNRVESDEALAFCRVDGTGLIQISGSVSTDAGTVRFTPASVSSEIATNILPTPSGSNIAVAAAPTAALPEQSARRTNPELSRPKQRRTAIVIAVMLTAIVAAITAVVVDSYLSRKGAKSIQSIAVMPFSNESGNADTEYLSDGITETLISSLAQLPNLNVKARSTVFRYKGKTTEAKSIGKELNVQAVLNGRVMQRGDQLMLSLELVNAETENVIWSESYNRKDTDLVNLQSEIARDVLGKLKTKLSDTDQQKLAKTYTANPEAYRFYLQGRFYWNKREEKEFRKAVDYFNQAIALDPNYALAYAGLADSYALLSGFGFMLPAEAVPKAREFAGRAMAIDDSMAEPHTTLAYVMLGYDYDFVGAERGFKRAIELNPNYATAHQWYGEMLTNAGRFNEAAVEFRRALELEPLSLPFNWDYSRFFYYSRQYDQSLVQHRKTIELDPSFARAHRTLAEVYRVKGDYANALEERAKFFDLIGQSQNAALIRATFAKEGWTGFVRLAIASDSPLKESNNSWALAKAYLDIGDKEKALAELSKAYQVRLSSLLWLKVEPQMDPLRSDARYQELLRKIKFPQ